MLLDIFLVGHEFLQVGLIFIISPRLRSKAFILNKYIFTNFILSSSYFCSLCRSICLRFLLAFVNFSSIFFFFFLSSPYLIHDSLKIFWITFCSLWYFTVVKFAIGFRMIYSWLNCLNFSIYAFWIDIFVMNKTLRMSWSRRI